jgi:hypothetical protein
MSSTLSSMVIVDCGSGYSRAARFHRSPVTNLVQATSQPPSSIGALHSVLHCPRASLAWLRELVALVREVDAAATDVLLGATGGVRDRVSAGEIAAEEVARFRRLLATTAGLPFTARLLVLGGEEEAGYELLSAEYCATLCDFVPTGDQGGSQRLTLGLLSSGGMSSQISAEGISISIPTEVKTLNKLGVKYGMDRGIDLVRRQAKHVIEHHVPAHFGGENVLYVAIEMFGGVGEQAGMSGSTVGAVSVADAIERLSHFVAEAAAEDRTLGNGARTWRTYWPVNSGIVATLILQRLHPAAKVVFVREFEPEAGRVLKPTWSLGYAIANLSLSRPNGTISKLPRC